MKVKRTLALHSSKDNYLEDIEEMGLKGDAAKNYSYSLYEVTFECIVDTETGDIEVESINIGDGEGVFTR